MDPTLAGGAPASPPVATSVSDTFVLGWSFSLAYTTDRYECQYDKNYPDVTGIYQGCLFPASVSTYPCLTYNIGTGFCELCLTGYTLTSGICLENNCTTAQYKHYGVCYTLPPNCLTYASLIGCTRCADSTYQIVNQTCTRIKLNCTGATYYNSLAYICANVSIKCSTFDATNGNCLTCLAASDAVVDGSCITAPIPTCANRQYAIDGTCKNIDALCSTF